MGFNSGFKGLTFLSIYITDAHYERTRTRLKISNNYRTILKNLCSVSKRLPVGYTDNIVNMVKINHQPDATIFQFIILTFIYSSTCFGRFPAHHQELNDFSGRLWFYLRIVVTVVLCSWSGPL